MSDELIESGLRTYLLTITAITNIVADRVYPIILPQEPTLPAISIHNVGTVPIYLQGQRPVAATTRMQIDCYASDAITAKLLSKAVGEALILNSYQGVLFGSYAIRVVFEIEGGIDDFDDIPDDFRVSSEYRIWHALLYNT